MIEIKKASIGNGRPILNNVTCTIPAGRITTFVGPSGVGKTTLLRSVAQLGSQPYQGSITIDGGESSQLSARSRAKHVGFVFQDFNLFPTMTVLENCSQPLIVVQGVEPNIARQRTHEQLALLGIEAYADRYPRQLSGGQQQRVALARALCLGPRSLLLDEPTSALDPANADMLATLVRGLAAQGMAIAISSQDMSFVKLVLDRAYLLEAGAIVDEFDVAQGGRLSPSSKLYSFLNYQCNQKEIS